jgi:lipopolysaccharide/colanic/teichoic acid biosynthesis glycosyltransferase
MTIDPSDRTTSHGNGAGNGAVVLAPGRRGFRGRGTGEVTPPVEVGTVETSRVTEGALRLLDLVGAAVLLVLLAPLLVLVAAIIRLDSAGSPIYRQRRLGRNLEPFSVAKFRTMRAGVGADAHRAHVERMIADEEAGATPMTKLSEDSRLTRVGAVLRRTSIDELPQLWNVLRGQMSLVGPRPPIQYEVDRYPREAFRRFAVRPGMTGLWQVRGRSLLTFWQMIELDTEYVELRSVPLNLKILLLTLPTVIHGKGGG